MAGWAEGAISDRRTLEWCRSGQALRAGGVRGVLSPSSWGAAPTLPSTNQPTGGNSHLGYSEPGGLGGQWGLLPAPHPLFPSQFPLLAGHRSQDSSWGLKPGRRVQVRPTCQGLGPSAGPTAPVQLGGGSPVPPMCWVKVTSQEHLFYCNSVDHRNTYSIVIWGF